MILAGRETMNKANGKLWEFVRPGFDLNTVPGDCASYVDDNTIAGKKKDVNFGQQVS